MWVICRSVRRANSRSLESVRGKIPIGFRWMVFVSIRVTSPPWELCCRVGRGAAPHATALRDWRERSCDPGGGSGGSHGCGAQIRNGVQTGTACQLLPTNQITHPGVSGKLSATRTQLFLATPVCGANRTHASVEHSCVIAGTGKSDPPAPQ